MSQADLSRLADAPPTNHARSRLAREYLAEVCEPLDYPIPNSQYRSFACTVSGRSPARVLIGAHYDKQSRGQGVADNWSGVMLTRALLDHFTSNQPRHTLEFVMFGEEEPGMLGSASFLRQRNAEEFAAMVNVDTLGLDPLTIDTRSDDRLECLAHAVAGSLGVEKRSLNLRISTGDWASFKQKGVPVLNIHSLDRWSYRIVHTTRDQLDAVDVERVNDAYRVIVNVIENLDLVIPGGDND